MTRSDVEFRSFDGTRLRYFVCGDGVPIILLHGFIVDSEINWGHLLPPIVAAGRQAIALDSRGHGASAKPHDPAAYANRAMARDVTALIDHLGLPKVEILGCSQGGFTAIEAALSDDRITRLILNGVGIEETSPDDNRACADGLLEDDPTEPTFFRLVADEFDADRKAIAAWFTGADYPQVVPEDLCRLSIPVTVINGDEDFHDGHELASFIEKGQAITVPGDHVSCLETPEFEQVLISIISVPSAVASRH